MLVFCKDSVKEGEFKIITLVFLAAMSMHLGIHWVEKDT